MQSLIKCERKVGPREIEWGRVIGKKNIMDSFIW